MVTACNYHSAFSIHKELRALLSWRSRQFENSFILPHVVILMSQPIGEMSVVRSYGYGSQMSLYIINSCSTVSIAKAKYVNVSTSKLVVYKESPPGAASGMSRCHFFGWLLILSWASITCNWAEILIHGSQPILDPCIKISWTLANFMAWFMVAQNWP